MALIFLIFSTDGNLILFEQIQKYWSLIWNTIKIMKIFQFSVFLKILIFQPLRKQTFQIVVCHYKVFLMYNWEAIVDFFMLCQFIIKRMVSSI